MSDSEDVNFASETFDPIKALYSRNVEPPNPDVPIMDNMSRFELTSEGELITKKTIMPKKKESEEIIKTSDAGSNQPSTSSVKVEEEPSASKEETSFKRKPLKNVIVRMKEMNGPLSKLKFCMEQRQRIKVCTRHGYGVRGTLEGFLEAFDKQWNLALRDVHEVWTATKKNKEKAPPIVGGKVMSENDAAFRREMFGIKVPRVAVLNTSKKRATFERHIDQLLVRGEQIVFIIV